MTFRVDARRPRIARRRTNTLGFVPAREDAPDLEGLAASQVAACLVGLPVGAPLPLASSSDLCFILELLIPALLRTDYPEWGHESIDGFFFASAVKSDRRAATLAGTCILMSDQTVTPFILNLDLADQGGFDLFRIRLGDLGHGPLGISGPAANSTAAQTLLLSLNARLDQVDWAYDVHVLSVTRES